MSNIPDLHIRPQECPICDEDLESEGDGYLCTECEIFWDWDGLNAEIRDDIPQCESTHGEYQCALALDHSGVHMVATGHTSMVTWNSRRETDA